MRLSRLIGSRSDGNVYRRGTSGGGRGAQRGAVEAGWRLRHTGNADRLRDFVRDAIAGSAQTYDATRAMFIDGLRKTIENPQMCIEHVAGKEGLTREQLQATLDAWGPTSEDFGQTITGVANAFTLGAQGMADPERRFEVELAGAKEFLHLN